MNIFELKGLKILVVDDDADAVMMFAELLKHEGGLVDKTQSPASALQLIENGNYDLLISDVSMPEMNGYDFIKKVRFLDSGCKLLAVAMTGHGRQADEENAKNSGFDIHLFKPVSLKQLKEALARYKSSTT